MRSPRHTIFVVTITVAAVSAGCARARDAAEPPPSKLERAEAEFARVADRRGVVLADVERPAPPRGYDANDVDQLVRDATDVLDRSVDPSLSRLGPIPAAQQVLAKQYDDTAKDTIDGISGTGPSLAWIYASRLPVDAGLKSWTLAARAEAHVERPSRGSSKPYLVVSVRAFFLHRVTIDEKTDPIVVSRQISIASYDPSGGPDYSPALLGSAAAYGNDFCPLPRESLLQPSRDPNVLQKDARSLRRALAKITVQVPDGDNSDYEKKAQRCET